MEFLTVDSLESAREKLLDNVSDWLVSEEIVALDESLGRVAARDIFTEEDIPTFRRSTVDGYAVLSENTAAADESIPVFLTLKGRIEMGQPAHFSIINGECAEVSTGGMIPEGANAVVMVEYTEELGTDAVAVGQSVAHGENVVLPGEDAKAGDILVKRGRRILPQDIGALAAAGVVDVPVYTSPKVTCISTGDELVVTGKYTGECIGNSSGNSNENSNENSNKNSLKAGQIRDSNSHGLAALARKHGFTVIKTSVLPDEEKLLENSVLEAMKESDIVIVSGGSSKGKKDLTKLVFDRIGKVHTHGIALQPGKPTILGFAQEYNTILAGLPGHPVSAMMVFEQLLGWLLRKVTGTPSSPAVPAKLSCNTVSSPGRLTCHPCRLIFDEGNDVNDGNDGGNGNNGNDGSNDVGYNKGYIAEPIFGRSGLITTLTQATGYFVCHRDVEGFKEGQIVMVHLF